MKKDYEQGFKFNIDYDKDGNLKEIYLFKEVFREIFNFKFNPNENINYIYTPYKDGFKNGYSLIFNKDNSITFIPYKDGMQIGLGFNFDYNKKQLKDIKAYFLSDKDIIKNIKESKLDFESFDNSKMIYFAADISILKLDDFTAEFFQKFIISDKETKEKFIKDYDYIYENNLPLNSFIFHKGDYEFLHDEEEESYYSEIKKIPYGVLERNIYNGELLKEFKKLVSILKDNDIKIFENINKIIKEYNIEYIKDIQNTVESIKTFTNLKNFEKLEKKDTKKDKNKGMILC